MPIIYNNEEYPEFAKAIAYSPTGTTVKTLKVGQQCGDLLVTEISWQGDAYSSYRVYGIVQLPELLSKENALSGAQLTRCIENIPIADVVAIVEAENEEEEEPITIEVCGTCGGTGTVYEGFVGGLCEPGHPTGVTPIIAQCPTCSENALEKALPPVLFELPHSVLMDKIAFVKEILGEDSIAVMTRTELEKNFPVAGEILGARCAKYVYSTDDSVLPINDNAFYAAKVLYVFGPSAYGYSTDYPSAPIAIGAALQDKKKVVVLGVGGNPEKRRIPRTYYFDIAEFVEIAKLVKNRQKAG